MKTLSARLATQRIIWPPILAGLVMYALQTIEPPLRLILAGVLVALLAVNAVQVVTRRAFTQAVENMRPMSQADDDTLFPEEIDPYQAKPSAGAIVAAAAIQIMIGSLAWFCWHYAVEVIRYFSAG
jgi:hypothetical protein